MTDQQRLLEALDSGGRTGENVGMCIGQNPKGWFDRSGLSDVYDMIFNTEHKRMISRPPKRNIDSEEVRYWVFRFLYGDPKCVVCGVLHKRTKPAWKIKGFWQTCGNPTCLNKAIGKHMIGKGNSYHKLSLERQNQLHERQSQTMKQKILNGEFTPNSANYMIFDKIRFRLPGDVEWRVCRSVWELIFWILNPGYLYETVRMTYEIGGKEKVYIADFYDPAKNVLFELKPSKYQKGEVFVRKIEAARRWAVHHGATFEVVDERYIAKIGRLRMLDIIEPIELEDRDMVVKRMRAYKNESCED